MTVDAAQPGEDEREHRTPMHWSLSRIWDDVDADPRCRWWCSRAPATAPSAPAAIRSSCGPSGCPRTSAHWYQHRERARPSASSSGCWPATSPIIARLNGHAVGFGSTLALAADLIVGVEGAKFGDPHCSSGARPAATAARCSGPSRSGTRSPRSSSTRDASCACRRRPPWASSTYAVPRDQLDAKVDELAQRDRKRGAGRAIQMTKNVMNHPAPPGRASRLDGPRHGERADLLPDGGSRRGHQRLHREARTGLLGPLSGAEARTN